MFRFLARRRAVAAAVSITQPLISALTLTRDLPERFWNDPYALGYLVTTMGFAIDMVAGNRPLSDPERAQVLVTAFRKLSGLDGMLLLSRVEIYLDYGHSELELGKENAKKVINVCYGMKDQSEDADVLRAAISVAASDTGIPGDNIGGALIDELFTSRLKMRMFPDMYRDV